MSLLQEKYKAFHTGLPVTVAETLLRTDPQTELPLRLVHMFKDFRRDRTWGMTGQVSNPASLFRLYVDYGRFTEATNLLLEYLESFASVRPSELILRKRPFAAWFPYSTIERLWCQLDELINLGHMVDQCDKLKKLLHGALLNHLKLLKVDSDDALSSAAC
ncbi:nuclear pore complex protein NUP160-like [Hevea brasiliensis]|uniref:nuclear pore complex protein NUP160-like n=1 Tax=Hevea brasiliensis TaxID=3981 RepID=UPI0025EB5442|nr:nuclear pore complex protein NUP160-like [Hevea brasiliensis]